MVRKSGVTLIALAALGLLLPTMASARGGHGGGGHHGGGWHQVVGIHGGIIAFHDRLPFGTAPGLYPPYAYGFPYYGPDAYPYDYEYATGNGCAVVQRLVHTRHGTWFRPVEVCDLASITP
jgi:hypothetical protein